MVDGTGGCSIPSGVWSGIGQHTIRIDIREVDQIGAVCKSIISWTGIAARLIPIELDARNVGSADLKLVIVAYSPCIGTKGMCGTIPSWAGVGYRTSMRTAGAAGTNLRGKRPCGRGNTCFKSPGSYGVSLH